MVGSYCLNSEVEVGSCRSNPISLGRRFLNDSRNSLGSQQGGQRPTEGVEWGSAPGEGVGTDVGDGIIEILPNIDTFR